MGGTFCFPVNDRRLRLQHTIQRGWKFDKVGDNFNNFYHHHLPFQLTNAQKRVLKEIRVDTATGKQMNRLVQGDVGSGKTIIAVMSMLLAMDNGHQACMMAPTEILAQQHYQGVKRLLDKMNIPVALLTGSIKGKERKEILQGLADGSIPIAVGTHALIEDTIKNRYTAKHNISFIFFERFFHPLRTLEPNQFYSASIVV